ncbi:MAG: zinc metalloprotease HtpX [Elusimicrobia bacterium RIFCSPLOWO2_12_FULL_59_9]|nr:MAG: zinc metalloprotease HtpX [Elusimicrobia bacterium RIFCSPLOWO2_12_FULL_59_9]
MKRVMLFIAINLLVVVTISLVINLLGVRPYITSSGMDYYSLLVFCGLFGFGGALISLQLSRWMAKQAMGVVLVDPKHPASEAERMLVDKVQSLCLRAGLSTLPEIGFYESPEVNAFATGPSRNRALLAVSTGLFERMDERALEGVLGHEVSHIANGDMVTMTLIQGVVNTFVMFFARVAVFAIDHFLRDRNERGEGLGFFAHMIVISILETLLMLLAAPIIYYFSRSREYRADSGSAAIAGRETMIHALRALKSCTELVDNRQTSLATLKINGHTKGLISMLFSSHPPIDARIDALRLMQ